MKQLLDPTLETSQPKAGRAYSALRNAIISMRFEPGQILNEKDICAALDVSRTPFREAILRLATENLVRVVPSDATYVNEIVIQDVLEGQLIRQTLELRVIGLAARGYKDSFDPEFELILFQQRSASSRNDHDAFSMLDNAFHQMICRVAGFPKVWDAIRAATGQVDRVRRRSLGLDGQMEEARQEHEDIFAALRAHDAATARALMEHHLEDILRATRNVVEEVPGCIVDADVSARLQTMLDVK